MNRELLLEILNDWNFWKRKLDTGKERKPYLEKCLSFLKTNVATAIIGVRRSGKSYIMRQVMERLIETGTESRDILMVNLEDRRFMEFYPRLLDEIYEAYLEHLNPGKIPFIFLDEVHNVPQWERWVRTMHELGKARIVISGSSSKLLSGELATVLTGRHLDIFIFPLSFREFLHFRGLEAGDRLDLIEKKTDIERLFNEYLEHGGFPEVALSRDKKQLLLTYFDDILTKDIERRYRLKRGEKMRALARFYLTNISSPVTFNSLGKHLDTTTNTVEKFSSYMEEANVIFFVKRFSFKVKEQDKSARKVYAIDTGLANAVGFRFSSDIGKTAENIVAIELKRRGTLDPNMEVYYWRDPGHEVDFVCKEGAGVRQLIQVCWDTSGYRTEEREVKALLKACRELKCRDLLIITGDKEGRKKAGGRTIRFMPLWKWLLI